MPLIGASTSSHWPESMAAIDGEQQRIAHREAVVNAHYTPFSPPMAQTIRHSSAVTGWTDSRAYLVSAMSLSRGSDFTVASVTGFGKGLTAFTSTATNTPFGSVLSV